MQALGYDLGVMTAGFRHLFPDRPVDASHPEILLDFNRCILCELCVRAAREVDGKHVFTRSFGKDQPAVVSHDEAAWSKNRRGEFILVLPKKLITTQLNQ